MFVSEPVAFIGLVGGLVVTLIVANIVARKARHAVQRLRGEQRALPSTFSEVVGLLAGAVVLVVVAAIVFQT